MARITDSQRNKSLITLRHNMQCAIHEYMDAVDTYCENRALPAYDRNSLALSLELNNVFGFIVPVKHCHNRTATTVA